MRPSAAILFAFVLLGVPSVALADNEVRPPVVPPEGSIPDLTQTDPAGNFANGGRSFCGPVAVSNSLMAIYEKDLYWEEVTHHDLVNQLASLSFMNTHEKTGTSVSQLLRGVELYLQSRKEKGYYLKFQGWRPHDLKFRTNVNEPRLSWIQAILAKGGAVWANVGWYQRTDEEGALRRMGGHWVTIVGFGEDAAGKARPDYLIIHDPAPRAGIEPGPEHVRVRPLESGKLVGRMQNLPRPARNILSLEDGMHIKPGAQFALMDGAVGLLLKNREEKQGQ